MAKKRLIYVSSPYTGAVVEGQVYELLEYYKQQDWFEDVLLLQSYASDEDRHKGEETLEKFTFRKKFFWMNPYYPFFYKKSVKNLSKVLESEVDDNSVFHVRSGIFAAYVRDSLPPQFKRLMILDEFRGFLSDELQYIGKRSIKTRILNYFRKKHIIFCNRKMQSDERILYSAVSPKLREIEVREEKFNFAMISVHPNIAATYFKYDKESRLAIRKELGISDDKILVATSSGESGAWQKDLDIIDTLIAKGYFVLNLSKNIIDKANVISRFVPHKEMPAYLSACDAALLWRDNVALNNVASPSKYSEFACMGLYVIHNKSVDLVTRFISDNNCGLLVDSPDEIVIDLNVLSEEERLGRCKFGLSKFSIDNIARDYYNILSFRDISE